MNFMKYDSPFSQLMIRIADIVLLNLLYLVCCIPVFTIGAAQAGLYTAAKVMLDKEDDSSVFAAFFRGFKAGFGTITACWGLVTLLLLFMIWIGVSAYLLGASIIVIAIGIFIVMVFQCALPAFHSRFGANFKMLMRNTLFFIAAYPLQCIGITLMTWFPIGLMAALDFHSLLSTTPVWALFYFSTVIITGYMLLRKPFNTLIDNFTAGKEKEEIEK